MQGYRVLRREGWAISQIEPNSPTNQVVAPSPRPLALSERNLRHTTQKARHKELSTADAHKPFLSVHSFSYTSIIIIIIIRDILTTSYPTLLLLFYPLVKSVMKDLPFTALLKPTLV